MSPEKESKPFNGLLNDFLEVIVIITSISVEMVFVVPEMVYSWVIPPMKDRYERIKARKALKSYDIPKGRSLEIERATEGKYKLNPSKNNGN